MSLPSERELKGVVVRLLKRARDEGRLDQLTVRIVLRELAAHYDVEEDVFQSEDYKPFIKATVHATIRSFEDASDGDAKTLENKESKSERAKASKRKRRLGHAEDADVSESGVSAHSKHSKTKNNRTFDKPVKSGRAPTKPESESKYKSKAIIESSDEETAPGSGTRKSIGSSKEKTPRKSSPLKPKQKQQKVDKDDSDVEMGTGEGPGPSSSSSKLRPMTESPRPSASKVKEPIRDPMESELSSVVDEPPVKRKKKQEKAPAKPQRDEKVKQGKKKESLSKDEETVNKLKGIVLACGVRKLWKKEFEGLDKPSQQIGRLHSILGDLGMTPRYSLEKAKAIRGERELAQELKDVQEFDRAVKRRGKGSRSSSEIVESMNEDGGDANIPARKKQNARASIMAFLQDQSEEE